MPPKEHPLIVTLLLVVGLSLPILGQGERRAFITSASGPADFSQWTESGGLTGPAGADAICQNLASAANLANPQNFVAWISDSVDDAYCRLHGFGGKKADDCAQSQLPEDAGPWLRIDDYPFAAAVPFNLGPTGSIWGPLKVDETGNPIAELTTEFVFTGSDSNGVLSISSSLGTCHDWSSAASGLDVVRTGRANGTTEIWSSVLAFSDSCECVGPCRLYCLERQGGPPIVAGGPGIRLAFLTSATGPGDFTLWNEATPGISDPLLAADSICQNLASDAGLEHPETFKAYLSTSTHDAASRFAFDGPWWRTEGIRFTENLSEFEGGLALSSLHLSELGQYSNRFVWTGAGGETCSDWQDSTETTLGGVGLSARTDLWQVTAGSQFCDNARSIYCLADRPIPLVFEDGFESGDTTLWSSTLP